GRRRRRALLLRTKGGSRRRHGDAHRLGGLVRRLAAGGLLMRIDKKIWGGAAFAALLAVACIYSPSFEDGKLHCSDKDACPKGYGCHADNLCYKGGAVTTPPSVDNFLGHWLFQPGSTRTINCTDGSTDTKGIETDYVDVTRGTTTALLGSYYCDWNLTLNNPPTKTAVG